MDPVSKATLARPSTHSDVGLFEKLSVIFFDRKSRGTSNDNGSMYIMFPDIMADPLHYVPMMKTFAKVLRGSVYQADCNRSSRTEWSPRPSRNDLSASKQYASRNRPDTRRSQSSRVQRLAAFL